MFHYTFSKIYKPNKGGVQRTIMDSSLPLLSNSKSFLLKKSFRVSLQQLVVIFMMVTRTSGLLTGEHQPYDVMCRGNSSQALIAVPWDCGGYIQCMPLGGGEHRAVWVQCAEGRSFHPRERACVHGYTQCPDLHDAAKDVCNTMPGLQFPHATSCAMYHDCGRSTPRDGLGVYEAECAHPLLFSQDTFRCEIRDMNAASLCGTRPVPKEKCHYRLGCNVTSCEGLSDGEHPDPAAPFTEQYYVCQNGMMVMKSKCEIEGHIFDPISRSCTGLLLPGSVKSFCLANPTAIFSDPTKCSLFYDCSRQQWHKDLKPYQTECAYPRMFDELTRSCAAFSDVACGNRALTCAPCDYTVGHCVGLHCIPCSASCKGLPDGANTYPGLMLTDSFLLCHQHRTRDILTCPAATLFDPHLRRCAGEISPEGLDSYCLGNPAAIIPHPSQCSLYYNCSLGSFQKVHENLPGRVQECAYPQLVDVHTGQCAAHTRVTCGPRREPLAPCDYVSNRCIGDKCPPCEDLLPSCTGKKDGYYPFINHEMTSRYTVCEGQRVVGAAQCPEGTIFDQLSLHCMDVVSTDSLLHYCTAHPGGRVESTTSCVQYYDCAALFDGVQTCPDGQHYDVLHRKCLASSKVDCGKKSRKTKESVLLTVISAANEIKNITSSHDKMSNEDGGLNQDQVNVIQSIGSVIATTSPSPKLSQNIHTICILDTSLVFPKEDNCGQFYNCSLPFSSLGPFIDECPVGHLFDDVTNSCRPFEQVTCGTRFEPMQACDYRLLCLKYSNDSACSACRELHPSCEAADDGPAQTFGGFKGAVLFCRKGRSSDIITCPVGTYFDNIQGLCSSELRKEVIVSACALTPGKTISHPTNCAKFIQCSKVIATAGGVQMNFKVGECPYPLLFQDGVCQSFKSVTCGMRKEPIAPCDYSEIANKCTLDSAAASSQSNLKPIKPLVKSNTKPSSLKCPPCHEEFPACSGLKDGFHAHPGQLFTPHFIQCEAGRTMAINTCIGSVFDPSSRTCGLSIKNIFTIAKIIPKYFCGKYPTAVIPHPTLCHRYFSCPKKDAKRSKNNYVKSCPYPDLFDTNHRRCDSFAKVFLSKGCNDSEKAR